MKYEESLTIDEDGKQQEIIHLYDLNQTLVLDYNQDPSHIVLSDMTTGAVIKRFTYGENRGDGSDYEGSLEGFSFAVSPRHNYLIIKEAIYGQSVDDLYATLYCLKSCLKDCSAKDAELKTPRNVESLGALKTVEFHSWYHLTFMFSNDEDESELWVQGQMVDNLELIDHYQYGGSEPVKDAPQCTEAKLYKVNSYPSVPLDHEIRDGGRQFGLAAHTVVNDLNRMKRDQLRALSQIDLDKEYIAKLYKKHNDFSIEHLLLASSTFAPDTQAIKSMLDTLDLKFYCAQDTTKIDVTLETIVVYSSPESSISAAMQTITLLSKLAQEHGLVYQGYSVTNTQQKALTWQQAIELCFGQYQFLCQSVTDKTLSLDSFIPRFHALAKIHNKLEFDDYFSETQWHKLDTLSTGLSQFDDYDITEAQLLDLM
ncbi:MAG: hypothetical protein HRT35_28705 [Algicola sp.]|nr:hypothetical protein [Algicola sp.]